MTVKIDFSRDALFDELGLIRLRESYMRPDEKSPQERLAFVAEQFASNDAHAQRIYDYASRHWLSFSTPILSFGRSKNGLPVSCYLTYMADSADGLVLVVLDHQPQLPADFDPRLLLRNELLDLLRSKGACCPAYLPHGRVVLPPKEEFRIFGLYGA